jgi:hypothetical protein
MTVIHADWSKAPSKRWMASAERNSVGWTVQRPCHVPLDTGAWVVELRELAQRTGSPVVLGMDFPIGVPTAYGRRAELGSFRDLLDRLTTPTWSQFLDVATAKGEIGVTRPFYPRRPGGTARAHLAGGLGLKAHELLRECERAQPHRVAASPLFWTLGARQVGRAAITGWREVVMPASQHSDVGLWPFDGSFETLVREKALVIVETYPAEFYARFGFPKGGWSKRRQDDRRKRGAELLSSLAGPAVTSITLSPGALADLREGFTDRPDGEDPFDALVGAAGMIRTIEAGDVPCPRLDQTIALEGWVFGQHPLEEDGSTTSH